MIAEKFPFLFPLRVKQRKLFFYLGMRFDKRVYSKEIAEKTLPYKLVSSDSNLYNHNTGFDMIYQENKVHNLKLAAKTLNGLLIKPNETFSLSLAIRHADKNTPYKDGLTVHSGKLTTTYGGGLCQMSNLLFWVFLHTPLTIVERHTHKVKDFPTMRSSEPEGVDAGINEGWIDLKVRNDTAQTFQINISFDDKTITGSICTDKPMSSHYEIVGRDLTYYRKNGKVYQKISIYRIELDNVTNVALSETLLYTNLCVINYTLPDGTEIIEKGANI